MVDPPWSTLVAPLEFPLRQQEDWSLVLCCTCPTNWPGPQKQSNNQIWKMGRGTKQTPGRARKQSKRASEQSKRTPEQLKMTKNNAKTSKTSKNHTPGGAKRPRGAAEGGACVIFNCFGRLGIVFGHFYLFWGPFGLF